jgi:bifunctional non-homologous end joining protein LigD
MTVTRASSGKRMGLKEYKAKRDFAVTAEPRAASRCRKAVKGASRFVIQKTGRITAPLRLPPRDGRSAEIVGCAERIAVGQGREAPGRRGEDHPIEYETFEGVIPAGLTAVER